MASTLANAPLYPEALPAYRPRGQADPDTLSIHSSAPSYVSEAPSYRSTQIQQPSAHSSRNSNTRTPTREGLPPAHYAPGFQSRAATHPSRRSADPNIHNYSVAHWSSINSSHASRQYHNVAARRASASAFSSAALLSSMTTTAAPPSTIAEEASSSTNRATPNASSPNLLGHDPRDEPIDTSPLSPLEDPYLVGEEAAKRARQQRIYREMCIRGEDARRHEGKAWDFMWAQMADWEERSRSWNKFRAGVGRTKLLGPRLGRR